jgi:hypothetical protein
MVERRGACRVLMGRLEGKRPLGRPKHRWKDNIKMNFQEAAWGDMDLIDLTYNKGWWRAVVNAVMNLRVP